jgi:hypothetical protein
MVKDPNAIDTIKDGINMVKSEVEIDKVKINGLDSAAENINIK